MSKNDNLHAAKTAKNDEFYTQLSDIENELKHYKDFFKGKVVYCNCDDARDSNFFKYFSRSFEFLGIKKLICTGFKANGKGVVLVYEGDKNGNLTVDDEEIKVTELEGDGDFRSEECIAFLKEADVVVSNPPFSLFREYVAQLMEYNKKFLIIGNKNAISFKEIFPLIKDNNIWLGVNIPSDFIQPVGAEKKSLAGLTRWFTNIDYKKRHQPLDLYAKYSNESYPQYDNYDAIECNKTADIPMDYDGVIGVPITFPDKYCPEQFEIVGMAAGNSAVNNFGIAANYRKHKNDRGGCGVINGKRVYARILIRRKSK